jgi:hypothetical protein
MICAVLAGSLAAQNASVSFRTGSIIDTSWCAILDSAGVPLDSGSFIGFYLVGADGEVDPPSSDSGTCGDPTDDDVRAIHNAIGNGMDHYVVGFHESLFVPPGNLYTGNGTIMLPDSGSGTEPVVNIGDRFYLRAFNSDSVHTATHYNNLFIVDGDTVNTYLEEAPGPATAMVCFTEAIPLNCGSTSVGPQENPSIVTEYRLYQNYPNPFNPSTMIDYDVKSYGHVTIRIFNLLGQVVATPVDNWKDMGRYSTNFNAEMLASGIYFYEFRVNGFRDIKKMIILR